MARQSNSGIDVTASYAASFGIGDLYLDAKVSYILEWEGQFKTKSIPTSYLDVIGNPDWYATVSARFARKGWLVSWSVKIADAVDNYRQYPTKVGNYYGQTVYFDRDVDLYIEHAVSVRRRFDKWSLIAGVSNVFDEGPGITSQIGGGRGRGNVPLSSQYDYAGRTAFINITRSW